MVLEQVCRLARVISSPHDTAHCVLVAEGCPGRASTITKLAAHLANFTIYRITPSPIATTHDYDLESFKADLVTGYTRAGVKVNYHCSFIFSKYMLLSTHTSMLSWRCPSII